MDDIIAVVFFICLLSSGVAALVYFFKALGFLFSKQFRLGFKALFISGGFALFVPAVCVVLYLGVFSPKQSATRPGCHNNLRQIIFFQKLHANDHEDSYSATFNELVEKHYLKPGDESLFTCISSGHQVGSLTNVSEWTDYAYVSGLTEADPANCVVAFCLPKNHQNEGACVAFIGGQVQWYSSHPDPEMSGGYRQPTFQQLINTPSLFFGTTNEVELAQLKKRTRIIWPQNPRDARSDLWGAVTKVLWISGVLCCAAYFALRRASRGHLAVAAVCLAGGMLAFGTFLADSAWIARLLPYQDVVVYGNIVPFLTALLLAVVFRMQIPVWRRLLIALSLGAASVWSLTAPIRGGVVKCDNNWKTEVCMQTSPSTCSAAAAASLLRHYRIETTEQEMADLCLTTSAGTRFHGLLRGLAMKTIGTPFQVQVVPSRLSDLRAIGRPALLSVQLTPKIASQNRDYSGKWGWNVGDAHSVVVFGFSGQDAVEVGDPGVGLEHWNVKALEDLQAGKCIVLVERR